MVKFECIKFNNRVHNGRFASVSHLVVNQALPKIYEKIWNILCIIRLNNEGEIAGSTNPNTYNLRKLELIQADIVCAKEKHKRDLL